MNNLKPRLILLAVLLLTAPLQAQTYSVDWHKVAGGGGVSTGGVYTVTGTIGQPDAGALAGGSYSLTGGFWGIISIVQTPGAPVLSIAVINANQIVLYWPSAFPGFALQQDSSLGNTNWVRVSTNHFPIVVNSGSNSVTFPVASNQFFRLINP